jgi:ubiquitin-conjugating enzyme E2 N
MNPAKRIARETAELARSPPPGITAIPHQDNWRYFDVTIAGPPDTPFEGGVFKMELFLPQSYPLDPPKVRSLTKIYHPNFDQIGRICLNTLKAEWTPALNIQATLLSLPGLLSEPNPADPLDNNVAREWTRNRARAEQTAREWTRRYASP